MIKWWQNWLFWVKFFLKYNINGDTLTWTKLLNDKFAILINFVP